MEKVLAILAKLLSEFFRTEHIAIFQLGGSKAELTLKYTSGFHPESLENLKRVRTTIGFFQRLIKEGTFQIENEVFKDEPELASLVKLDGLESMIGVPIFSKGDVWGTLVLFSQETYRFKEEDGEALSLWGMQIGELRDFLSSYLHTRLDGNLVQVLGNIELLRFRLRNKKSIPPSEVVDALDRLENTILESSQNLDRLAEEPTLESKSDQKPAQEMALEEVITIEGDRPPPMEKRKVLIVDDQPIITDLLVDILKRMGYSSEVASGGKEGLKIFAKDSFDLVITDLGMPDVSGWEVSKSVKKQNPSVPVILITGWGVEPDPHKIGDSGIDFVINKPFQINQLERIVKELTTPRGDGAAT